MKKIVIASVLALAAFASSAVEIGLVGSQKDTVNSYGITAGQSFGKVDVTAGFNRAFSPTNRQDRYSIVGGYEVVKLGQVAVSATAGAAYLENQTSSNGYALTVGVGASLPITKKVSVGVDVFRQYGQERVSAFDSTYAAANVKYSF
jgi:hypothetical protein